MSKLLQMVVQLPLTGRSRTERLAHGRLEEALSEGFESHAYGEFDGSDTCEGKDNLYAYEISPEQWDAAVAFVVSELELRGLASDAVIARGTQPSDQEDAEFEHEVVWPEGFTGSFSTY